MKNESETLLNKNRYRSKLLIVLIACNIALSSFYFGYHNNCFATLRIQTMIQIYSIPLLPSTASGIINGIIPLSSIFGAILTYYFVTKLSRRKMLLYTNCIALIAGIIIFVQRYQFLLLARFLQGLCVGCYISMSPMIVRQLAPTEIAGTIGSIPQLFMISGVVFACAFQYTLAQIYEDFQSKTIWKYVLGFPLITVSIQTFVLIYIFPYETPKYLISKGDKDEAKKLIQVLYIDEYCEEVQMEKIQDLKAKIKHDKQIQQFDDQLYGGHSLLVKFKTNSAIIAIIISIAQQLSGVNPVSIYGYEIAKKSAESIRSLMPTTVNTIQLVGTLKSSYLLSKYGRKDLFIFGSYGMSLSLFSIFLGLMVQDSFNGLGTFLILVGLGLFSLVFGMTYGPCTWLYISEIADPEVVPYAAALNRLIAVLSITFFPIITTSLLEGDCTVIFLFFAVLMLYFSSFFKRYLIETKGKQEKQLMMEFKCMKFFS